jgi:hypothetical protein
MNANEIRIGETVTLWHPDHSTTGRVIALGIKRAAGELLPAAVVLVGGTARHDVHEGPLLGQRPGPEKGPGLFS